MSRQRGPMPKVTYGDRTYTLWSRKTVVPNFAEMDPISVYIWLCAHARPSGYLKADHPLAGMSGAVKVNP